MKNLKWILTLILVLSFSVIPAQAQEVESNGAVRLVTNPAFVVSLLKDGTLHYYYIQSNSQGFLVGYTPPGWRNDTLPPRLVDRVERNNLAAELYNLGGGRYRAVLYANGAEFVRGEFAGQGAVGSGFIARSGGTGVTTSFNPSDPPPIVSGSSIVYGVISSRDNGVSSRAAGTFDGTFYTIARGDTLYRIALRFNTTFSVLMAANSIPNANVIYAGQRLRIP